MYAIDRRVYVKSLNTLGTISERGFNVSGRDGKTRTAFYLVSITDRPGWDYLTGPRDLRAADFCCDECNKWFPEGSSNGVPQPRDPDGYMVAQFCFLCYLKFKKEYGYV